MTIIFNRAGKPHLAGFKHAPIQQAAAPASSDLAFVAWDRARKSGRPYWTEWEQVVKEDAAARPAATAPLSAFARYSAELLRSDRDSAPIRARAAAPAPPPREKTDQQKADEAEALARRKGIDIVAALKELGYWT